MPFRDSEMDLVKKGFPIFFPPTCCQLSRHWISCFVFCILVEKNSFVDLDPDLYLTVVCYSFCNDVHFFKYGRFEPKEMPYSKFIIQVIDIRPPLDIFEKTI
jgi:hypothetical protein